MPRSFCRTPCMHCSVHLQLSSEFSVSFFLRQTRTRGHSAPWRVARSLFPLASTPHTRLADSWCRWRRASPALEASAVAAPPVAASEGPSPLATPPGAPQRPLALRVSLPCQRTPVAPPPWPGKHGTCSLPPTGPRRPVPSSSPKAPNPGSFST